MAAFTPRRNRHRDGRRRPAALATNIGASVAWLALLSFAMISCCERLGDLLRCPSSVMGLTFGAVGTSFPNL